MTVPGHRPGTDRPSVDAVALARVLVEWGPQRVETLTARAVPLTMLRDEEHSLVMRNSAVAAGTGPLEESLLEPGTLHRTTLRSTRPAARRAGR